MVLNTNAECLQLALRNLHETTVQHTRERGVVWTAAKNAIAIDDEGPGIPANSTKSASVFFAENRGVRKRTGPCDRQARVCEGESGTHHIEPRGSQRHQIGAHVRRSSNDRCRGITRGLVSRLHAGLRASLQLHGDREIAHPVGFGGREFAGADVDLDGWQQQRWRR